MFLSFNHLNPCFCLLHVVRIKMYTLENFHYPQCKLFSNHSLKEKTKIISNEICELQIFFYTETCRSIYRNPTPQGEQGRVFQTKV